MQTVKEGEAARMEKAEAKAKWGRKKSELLSYISAD